MAREILDGGAPPDRSAEQTAVPEPRWARAVAAILLRVLPDLRAPRWGSAAITVSETGRRWTAFGLAAAMVVVLGWSLRGAASDLESAAPGRGGSAMGSTAGAAAENASWGSPVLEPGAMFTLAVQVGDRIVRVNHGREQTALSPLPPTAGTLADGGWATAAETVVLAPGPRGVGQSAVVMARPGQPQRQIGPGARILPGPHGWTAWVLHAVGADRFTLQGFGLDGTARAAAVAVPAGGEPVAVLRNAVVLSAPDRQLSVWDPGRDSTDRLDVAGDVVGAAQDLILVAHDCRSAQRCAHSLVNITSRKVTPLAEPDDARLLGHPVLSRDGLRIASMVAPDTDGGPAEVALAVANVYGGGDRPQLVPGTLYRTGRGSTLVSSVVPPSWSLDGRLFGYAPGAAGLYRYQPGEGGARRVDVPGLGSVTRIVAG